RRLLAKSAGQRTHLLADVGERVIGLLAGGRSQLLGFLAEIARRLLRPVGNVRCGLLGLVTQSGSRLVGLFSRTLARIAREPAGVGHDRAPSFPGLPWRGPYRSRDGIDREPGDSQPSNRLLFSIELQVSCQVLHGLVGGYHW